ncbi:hypothetical protein SSX86_024624 [Deinandra increscens subsp. villosa]|uniref:Ninja-family protein n=1 Tax=Deinandra increscens subsp. villosa TaxID=3103831 RepID=A0AAP0GN49_9ASTR
MADGSKNWGEHELMLELSIGGIFGESKKTKQDTVEKDDRIEDSSAQSKRQVQVLWRREIRRKREEKVGSCGSVSGPFVEDKAWLEKQVVERNNNDDGLEVEPVGKKERIESFGFWPMACRSFKVESHGKCSSSHHQVVDVATDDSRSNSSNSQHLASSTVPAPSTVDLIDQHTGSTTKLMLTNSILSERSPHESSVSNPLCKPDQATIQKRQSASFLARMPYVSTTGNGPNGKTVSGFLYRYTKNEVSIVCVCHGHSFTPAAFVEHAGGVDIAHPLRHITIFLTAFAS